MSILDREINGVRVRDTDLTQFKTDNALYQWAKATRRNLYPNNDDEASWEASDSMMEFIGPRRDELNAATEARKPTQPARNLDLVVIAHEEDRDPSMNYGMRGATAGEILGLLTMFDRAEQMTAWEFDAYDTLGSHECDAQGIENLWDMFGTEFAEAFHRRKRHLIARSELEELYVERRRLEAQIQSLEADL